MYCTVKSCTVCVLHCQERHSVCVLHSVERHSVVLHRVEGHCVCTSQCRDALCVYCTV